MDQEVIDFLIENNIEEILDNIMQKQEKDQTTMDLTEEQIRHKQEIIGTTELFKNLIIPTIKTKLWSDQMSWAELPFNILIWMKTLKSLVIGVSFGLSDL